MAHRSVTPSCRFRAGFVALPARSGHTPARAPSARSTHAGIPPPAAALAPCPRPAAAAAAASAILLLGRFVRGAGTTTQAEPPPPPPAVAAGVTGLPSSRV